MTRLLPLLPVLALALAGCTVGATVACPDPADFDTIFTWSETLYDPCVLDPLATRLCGLRTHIVVERTDVPVVKPQLVVHLAGSSQDAKENQRILRIAGFAGYRTIGLGYVNNTQVFSTCEHEPPGCQGPLREEVLYGADTSPHVDVSAADSAVTRLLRLLQHLAVTDPAGGWDAYVQGEEIVWENVILSGYSQGSGHAAVLARDHLLHGVVLFAGPGDADSADFPDPAEWVDDPRQTPGCVHYAISHTDETALPQKQYNQEQLGATVGPVDADTVPWPYDDAQQLTTSQYAPGLPSGSCDAHAAIGKDGCVADDLTAPYTYMFCAAGARDPSTCP